MKSFIIRGERTIKPRPGAYAIVYRVERAFDIHDDITKSKGVFVKLAKNRKNIYSPSYIKPRMIAMYFIRMFTGLQFREIASIFSVATRTPIHAEKWCKQMLENNDKEFAGVLRLIEAECDELYARPEYTQRKPKFTRKKPVRKDENKEENTGSSTSSVTSKKRAATTKGNV